MIGLYEDRPPGGDWQLIDERCNWLIPSRYSSTSSDENTNENDNRKNDKQQKNVQDTDNLVNVSSSLEAKKAEITVKPNPTNGQLNINSAQLTIDNIEIFDVVGKQYSIEAKQILPAEGTITIDISRLANGMYFLKIQTDNGIVTKKVVRY